MSDTFTFWPKDIVSELPISPLMILKEAATELGKLTQGAVEAEVVPILKGIANNEADYAFRLTSKALGFNYSLLSAHFNLLGFYPVTLRDADGEMYATNSDDLRAKLKTLLGAPNSIQAVKSLAAQASAS